MMRRRTFIQALAVAPLPGQVVQPASATVPFARVRPGDAGWPSDAAWRELGQSLEGQLIQVSSPLASCVGASADACTEVFKELKNPYFLGDEPALTQTLGWVGAWTSRPSVYAVAARSSADVSKAVNFAREHNLRLVVKGGGHSYCGTSNAADSLLIWTHPMRAVTLHDSFVPSGCEGKFDSVPAVSIDAGALWGHVYYETSVKGGRYVQGGGCMTVGVAGFLNGGGFGSLSKAFGTGAANLLEAEVVTADGQVRLANSCTNPDLLWALKGGGAGFGVVTRLTLRTHDLPAFMGGVFATVRANSDEAFRRLVAKTIDFYQEALFNPSWGEQIGFTTDRTVSIAMVFQGFGQGEATTIWKPYFDWISASPADYAIVSGPEVLALAGRDFWDPSVLRKIPGLVLPDDRPGVPESNIFWASNLGEAGQVLHAYQSIWLPEALLQDGARDRLIDSLIAASRHRRVTLHFNKGLAGGDAEAIKASTDTPIHPAALGAFALAITGAAAPPAYPGVAGHEPDEVKARDDAAAVHAAITVLRDLVPTSGAYVWEADYFQPDWQNAFWGSNYSRLRAIKQAYDPDGLFYLHHGVGSEDWSDDGMSRRS